MTHELLVLLKK